jgi:hypothetical protein
VHQNKQPPFRRFFVFGTLPDESASFDKNVRNVFEQLCWPAGRGQDSPSNRGGCTKTNNRHFGGFLFCVPVDENLRSKNRQDSRF